MPTKTMLIRTTQVLTHLELPRPAVIPTPSLRQQSPQPARATKPLFGHLPRNTYLLLYICPPASSWASLTVVHKNTPHLPPQPPLLHRKQAMVSYLVTCIFSSHFCNASPHKQDFSYCIYLGCCNCTRTNSLSAKYTSEKLIGCSS